MKRFLCFAFLLVCLCACLANGSLPVKVYALPELMVEAKSAVLVDYASGEVLLGQNPEEKLEIASMAKLMTIYLTTKALSEEKVTLEDEVVISEYAASMGGSQVFLDAGSAYPLSKLLQGVIMASANDASVALAEYLAGSEKEFVKLMNQTALSLDMNSTQYQNATGLPAPMQFSTAVDTAKMLSSLVENEIYHKYAGMWMDSLTHPSGRKTEVVNTNKLTRYFKGCDSGKTGFTDEAGYCLATSAKRDDMRLISVVMGAKTASLRFSESVKLLNYGFNNFENHLIVNGSEKIGEIDVKRSASSKADVFALENFSAVTKKGENPSYETVVNIDKSVKAPQKKGEIVGSVIVSKRGVVVTEIPLVINEDLENLTYGEAVKKTLNEW